MHILYLDEAGLHSDATYFVLAGVAVFERETYFYAQDLDNIQRTYFPGITDSIEFHASAIHAPSANPKPPFDQLSTEQRRQLLIDIYQIIRNHRGVVFGTAIEKAWCASEEPYERAFEDLTSRFDLYLRRINAQAGEHEQRGMIAVAESSYRRNLEVLGERFRGGSTRWGQIRTLADVPFFLPARNTRLLQVADFCANAIYGRYNSSYTRYFDIIAPRFDRDQNRIHGINHLTRDTRCQCIACFSRQAPLM
jgi:hypothetical protein